VNFTQVILKITYCNLNEGYIYIYTYNLHWHKDYSYPSLMKPTFLYVKV
jgi:hypothetical protein